MVMVILSALLLLLLLLCHTQKECIAGGMANKFHKWFFHEFAHFRVWRNHINRAVNGKHGAQLGDLH